MKFVEVCFCDDEKSDQHWMLVALLLCINSDYSIIIFELF